MLAVQIPRGEHCERGIDMARSAGTAASTSAKAPAGICWF